MTAPYDLPPEPPRPVNPAGADPGEVVRAGNSAWPSLAVEPSDLEQYFTRFGVRRHRVPATFASDVYLAFACYQKLPGAVAIFQVAATPTIASAARIFNPSEAFALDVRQRVLETLFVGTEKGGPRIVQYRGDGPLLSWVRQLARRAAFRMSGARDPRKLVSDDVLVESVAEGYDQELAFLAAHDREVLRETLSSAIRALPTQQRQFLQLYLVLGVSMTRIGKLYGVSQSTVSRDVARATRDVFEAAATAARDRLRVNPSDFQSLLLHLRSKLNLSVLSPDEAREVARTIGLDPDEFV